MAQVVLVVRVIFYFQLVASLEEYTSSLSQIDLLCKTLYETKQELDKYYGNVHLRLEQFIIGFNIFRIAN